MFVVGWLVVALESAPWLEAAAVSSPRPSVCVAADDSWRRARDVETQRRCTVLANGYAALEREPTKALAAANALFASDLKPEALVLRGRARLALGEAEPAFADLEHARKLGAKGADTVLALHDAAVAAALAGHTALSVQRYRVALPRWQLLPERRQFRLLLEAALAALRQGPSGLEEAQSHLDHAERLPTPRGGRVWLQATRALLAIRSGQAHPALEPEALRALVAHPRSSLAPRVPPSDLEALLATVHEATDPEQAREHWTRFAQSPLAEPWRPWLERRLGAMNP